VASPSEPAGKFSTMTRLLLTRHAQSEWNASGRWQGQADPPLSELGRGQAARAAEAVGSVDGIVASSLERARHTADIIAEAIGVGPVVSTQLLIERDAGEWSGLTRAEINVHWPGYLELDRRPPGYEPDEQFLARVLAGVHALAEHFGPSTDVLVVAHAGVIYALEAHLGESFERIPNLSGRWVEFNGVALELGPRVHLLEQDAPAPDLL